MKKTVALTLTAFFLACAGSHAAPGSCDEKRAEIEQQVKQTEAAGGDSADLQQALAGVTQNCTPELLSSKLEEKIHKLERKVIRKQGDIDEVQSDLSEARARGDMEKIAKYERKLAEKNEDLKVIKQELNEKRAELAVMK